MPVIRVSCLPRLEEDKLVQLFNSIVKAVVAVSELGLKDEKDMTILFPPDMMQYGLGSEIIIEVFGLFEKPKRTEDVRNRLATSLGYVLKEQFPKAMVECFINPFNTQQGFWTSKDMASREKVESIQAAVVRLLRAALAAAHSKCYCQKNGEEHKGPCRHHKILAAYEYYAEQGENVLRSRKIAEYQPLADVFVKTILTDTNVCGDIRHELSNGLRP